MHETQEPSTTAPEADLFVAVNDTVTVKASFLAHKPGGPSGEGFRAVDDDRTSISVDADVQGMNVSAIKAPPRHGEEGNDKVCAVLMAKLNKDGGCWVECECCSDAKTMDPDADCMLYGMTKAEMLKLLPVKRRNVPVQKVQLTRAIRDQVIWQEIDSGDTASFVLSAQAAANRLRDAIEAKKRSAKGVILALDGTDALWQVKKAVVDEFRHMHGNWAQSLGFDSIWVVGRTAELTFRLD
jgi:hypothetical protein